MEFDKNKILTSVTADQAKVGQKGWIGLTLSDLKYSFGKEDKKITLLSIRGENVTTRFVSDKYGAELLFYPAPEPSYRPFNDDELNDLVGKVVIQKHTGNAMLVIKVVDGETGKMVSLGGNQKRNAQQLLEGWTFKGGNPCGVREEA
jgi:hypothetical protein